MLTSNKNGKTQWKSSKSINPDFLDKPGTQTPINLTNRFESLHVAEENSGPVDKDNDVTPKNTIPNDKPKSRHSLRHTSEQGHRRIMRKKLVQQNKPINDANRRPPIVINSYLENDKLHDKLQRTLPANTTNSDVINKGRKVKIFGTSMIKDIRNKEFNFYLERCHAELKSYPELT